LARLVEVLDERGDRCGQGSAVLRLYLANVTYGGGPHLFAIGVEGRARLTSQPSCLPRRNSSRVPALRWVEDDLDGDGVRHS
jgi:hypothetical protein